jgi:hypothetical protein
MAEPEHQIVTLKRALGRHGVVCRMRTDRDRVCVDVFWRPPRVAQHMRPFTSATPLPLIGDLQRNGFASTDGVPIDGLFKHGIIAASFASGAHDAAELARSVLDSHGLAKSDRAVAWARRPRRNAETQGGARKMPLFGERHEIAEQAGLDVVHSLDIVE